MQWMCGLSTASYVTASVALAQYGDAASMEPITPMIPYYMYFPNKWRILVSDMRRKHLAPMSSKTRKKWDPEVTKVIKVEMKKKKG
jgi:hypothetical protein